jgi:hypothetical protein
VRGSSVVELAVRIAVWSWVRIPPPQPHFVLLGGNFPHFLKFTMPVETKC